MSTSRSVSVPRGSQRVRNIGLVLGPALFLCLLFLPGLELTSAERSVAGATALCVVFWITGAIPIGATSLLPAALFPLLGVMSGRDVAPVYMRDLVMLFLGAFVVALGLERWGVHRRAALFIVSRTGTSPRRLVLGFMLASGCLSMWINNTATVLMMLPIAMAVIEQFARGCDDEREVRNFSLGLLLGIAYSANVGGTATPVGTAPNQEFLGQYADRFPDAPEISFGAWLVGFVPILILFLPCAYLLITRVLLPVSSREDESTREIIERERVSLGPWSTAERRMAFVFVVTALLWVTRADLDLGALRMPGWSRVFAHEGIKPFVTDATVAVGMALVCFMLPAQGVSGPRLMDWETARAMPWDVILLLGGGFALARGFQVSGLDQTIGALLAPMMEYLPSFALTLAVALFVSFLTEMTSNTATTAVLLPILAQTALESGRHPLSVMVPATLAASCAFMLAVATPPNAVVFATGRIPATTMARVGFWLNLLAVVLIALVFEFWAAARLGV